MRYDRLRDFFSFVPFFLFLSMAAAACSLSFSFLLPFLQRSLCLSSAGLMKFDGDRACNYRLSRADACLALNSLTGEFVIIRKRGGWFNLFSPKFFFSFLFLFFRFFLSLSLLVRLFILTIEFYNTRENGFGEEISSAPVLNLFEFEIGMYWLFSESLRKSLGRLVKLNSLDHLSE